MEHCGITVDTVDEAVHLGTWLIRQRIPFLSTDESEFLFLICPKDEGRVNSYLALTTKPSGV